MTCFRMTDVDPRGQRRGRCNDAECDCDGYSRKKDDSICDQCGHFPAKLMRISGKKTYPLIKRSRKFLLEPNIYVDNTSKNDKKI